MVPTTQELDSFHRFTREKVDAGEAGLSLEQLVSQRHAARQRAGSDAAIHKAIDQMNAGLGEPLDVAMEDIRRRLHIPADFR